jgi:LmbE family N-acetylglucosaminyl deacetylase
LLYPLDWCSYAVYTIARKRWVLASPLICGDYFQRILVISPHADDELLGCGGFIAKYSRGRSIQVAYVTDGKGGSHRTRAMQMELAARRMTEARAVCNAMALDEPVFLNFEDGKLRNNEKLVPALESLISRTKPNAILAPFITDAHPDHIATSMALAKVSDAVLGGSELWLYQVHSHIPNDLLNRYLPLTRSEHKAKQDYLRLYVTQDMTRKLTLSKYLLFNKFAPQLKKPLCAVSVEHFAVMNCREFKELHMTRDVSFLASRIKSTNYSPYSFRTFLNNSKVLDAPPRKLSAG